MEKRIIKFRAFFKFSNLSMILEEVDVFNSGNIGVNIESFQDALSKNGWIINNDNEFENLSTHEKIEPYDAGCNDTGDDYMIVTDNFTIDQFTGYCSGDTLEMYEGDKVYIGKATAEIAWGDDGFVFVNQNEHWLDDWNLPDDSHRMKIIGHIHQTN